MCEGKEYLTFGLYKECYHTVRNKGDLESIMRTKASILAGDILYLKSVEMFLTLLRY